jgi:hypothetical protein
LSKTQHFSFHGNLAQAAHGQWVRKINISKLRSQLRKSVQTRTARGFVAINLTGKRKPERLAAMAMIANDIRRSRC